MTELLSFRAHVTRKLPKEQLSPDQLIPSEIMGFKTDVIPYSIPRFNADFNKHRPLIGGTMIESSIMTNQGTLGCFAQLNSTKNFVALTNAHVVGEQSGRMWYVGQPTKSNSIGCAISGESIMNDKIDAAIIHLCCSKATNVIRTLGNVMGSTKAMVGDTVIKVGMLSDKTVGRITSITLPTTNPAGIFMDNQIEITPISGTVFSRSGDSGSAIVNRRNQVMGLLWGGWESTGDPNYGKSVACPIDPVLTHFDISIPIGELKIDSRTCLVEEEHVSNLLDFMQTNLIQSEQGKSILKLVNAFSYEVLNLINHKRQVTVTWHRNKGAAFLSELGQSAKFPDSRISKEIEGINRKEAVQNITAILKEHGSEGLRTTINQYESLLLKISDYDTVNEIVNVLKDEI